MPSDKAQTVFGIAELLESILLYLDSRTLLVAAQRVNIMWRDTIKDSDKLQKKLFFRLATFEEAVTLNIVHEDSWTTKDESSGMAVQNDLLHGHKMDRAKEVIGSSFPRSILPDTISARRGKSSWERMYFAAYTSTGKPVK